ncbi:recombination regulator RecX [Bordetella petrii]|uniref:recombination regulator RecX n=1 Tax=Bordetella petrii TaxID=94624 RepID=UPI000478AE45|nr:recombination regulator RecX [Bordetella petrii]
MMRKPGSTGSPQGARRGPGTHEPDDGGFETVSTKPDPSKPRGPSLKARAVGYLSRREYARNELARKLQPYADDGADIDAVLDALEKEGWLSTERFAQSLVHRRAARQGTARIVQELRQHGVAEEQVAQLREGLRASEFTRAQEVWRKRFGTRPVDRAEYARQARFLAGRGFAHDVIRRLLGGDVDD